jgi:hypothetical protein
MVIVSCFFAMLSVVRGGGISSAEFLEVGRGTLMDQAAAAATRKARFGDLAPVQHCRN